MWITQFAKIRAPVGEEFKVIDTLFIYSLSD
jgi:hypothetical protein